MVSYGKVHYFVVNEASFPTPHFRVEVVLTAKAAGCLQRIFDLGIFGSQFSNLVCEQFIVCDGDQVDLLQTAIGVVLI